MGRCVRLRAAAAQSPRPIRRHGAEDPRPAGALTQVVGHVAQVRLHHGGVQGQVVPQQLQVPGVVFEVRLAGKGK